MVHDHSMDNIRRIEKVTTTSELPGIQDLFRVEGVEAEAAEDTNGKGKIEAEVTTDDRTLEVEIIRVALRREKMKDQGHFQGNVQPTTNALDRLTEIAAELHIDRRVNTTVTKNINHTNKTNSEIHPKELSEVVNLRVDRSQI